MFPIAARIGLVLAALAAPIGHAQAQEQCLLPPGETRVTEFGVRREPNLILKDAASGGSEKTFRGNDVGLVAAHYRFRIRLEPGAAAEGWSLAIRDQAERVQQILRPSDFIGAGPRGIWTRYLRADDKVTFDIQAVAGRAVNLSVPEAIVLAKGAPVPRYSRKGPVADYKDLYAYAGAGSEDARTVRRSGDRVAFIAGSDIAEAGRVEGVNWCCSGILLTADLLLTNWHCGGKTTARPQEMWRDNAVDGSVCAGLLIDMAWDDGSTAREAGCHKVEVTSQRFDYAILRIKPVAGSTAALTTMRAVRLAAMRPAVGTPLRIVHHAECKPKQVSFNCAVSEAQRPAWDGSGELSEFAHTCDTEGGSSGAPVFNTRGELVGLHHLGYEAIPGDPHKRCDAKNKAIHIDAILADVKGQTPALHDEIRAALAGP